MMVEFFNLAIEEGIKRLFEGDSLNLVPVKDATKLLLFRIVGTMFVHVVLQGGLVDMFPFLAPSIVAFLVGEEKEAVAVHLSKHHIPMNAATECLHLLLESLDNCKTDFDVQKLLHGEDANESFWQVINSSHLPKTQEINFQNRDLLIQELVYNELISSRPHEICELRVGLETLGFLSALRKSPQLLKALFCVEPRSNLQPKFGPTEFKDIITYANATNFAQNQSRSWFQEYLEPVEEANNEFCAGTRLSTLLMFVTGFKVPPVGGFLPDDDNFTLPTVSAYLFILNIPTVHSSKKKFFEEMDKALKYGSRGFRNP